MSATRLAKAAIKIPMRIERGPTDILRALASTVKHIPGHPEAYIHDDPCLIPGWYIEKKNYLASRLYGRRTARFILNKHPEFFYRDDAEPKVEAFHPPEEFRLDMEFTEDDIKWCIENNDCPNALIAYQAITEKGVELSDETLMQFFEMLCYTNEQSRKDFLDLESARLQDTWANEKLVDKSWKTDGLATQIFTKIKDDMDSPRIYSAMIAGLCKYNEFKTATQVYEDFQVNHPNTALYTIAYAGLINAIPTLHSSVETVNEALRDIIGHMEANLVKPDLQIFNAILQCHRNFMAGESTCQIALNLINDMKALDILPSLATYSHLARILTLYKGGQVYGYLISNIIDHIESEAEFLLLKDEKDSECINTLMNVIANKMNNLKLARQLHKIYVKYPNLFANQRYQVRYFNDFFRLIITTETLDNILEFYDTYVPMHFQPHSDNFDALADALELYQASEDVVKKIGDDIIRFKAYRTLKNDAIFRNDPEYVKRVEESI